MLKEVVEKGLLTAKAIIGIWPAASVGDDVLIYDHEDNHKVVTKFHYLRQQRKMGAGIPNLSLADYIAPRSSNRQDYMGCFAVSTGFGIEKLVDKFLKEHDDYNSIMIKALADRLAEALAEMMHQKVRKEIWGYAPMEQLKNEELIKEKYQGIRPAPGYPACPDHTEKRLIWDLMQVKERIGIELTESFAMYPTAAVSGFYFGHPDAKYFGIGKIAKDQIISLAERKNKEIEEIEKWLSPILGY